MDAMTDDQFAELTKDYVAATEARLALIKADLPATPEAVATASGRWDRRGTPNSSAS